MARRRKKYKSKKSKKSKKKKQKYIPIVVLNNRIPIEKESRIEPEFLTPPTTPRIRRKNVRPKVPNFLYYQDRRKYSRPPRLDRRLGLAYDLEGRLLFDFCSIQVFNPKLIFRYSKLTSKIRFFELSN